MDREELPFNRAERSWVYRAAKHVDTTVAFGSTRDLRPAGTVLFVNCAFPTLGADAVPPGEVTIGPYAERPYMTRSLYNISGMSYGALSAPAIRALAAGARKTGCWMNTGEGGVSPYHLEGGCDIVVQIGTAKYGVRDLDVKLQRGLNVANKAERVASFQDQIEHEVGIIAHSCGVHEPRQLRRFHCRVVMDNGRSMPLDELFPDQVAVEAENLEPPATEAYHA